jgi:hypothetical protein
VVSFADLRDADPRGWSEFAGAVRVLAADVADQADAVTETIARLGPEWAGSAAVAALGRLTALREALLAACPALVGVDQAVSEFAVTVAVARADLLAAIRPRTGSIVSVGADGVARLHPTEAAPDAGDTEDQIETARAIAGALDTARRADQQAAVRLRGTDFDPADAVAPAIVPPAGSDPALVEVWWSHLSAAEQRYLIRSQPAVVDGLDGIPADARDQAGRMLLHQQRASLSEALSLRDTINGSPSARATTAAIQARLAGLSALESRLDDPGRVRSYLLGLDAADNEAIVAIGNPDRASDVLTMVPGLGSGLTNIGATLGPIDTIYGAANALDGSTTELSAVSWTAYQAPQDLQDAMKTAPAVAAVPSLSQFDAGLRDTHIGPAAHGSVLGYSYGSVVVGLTGQAEGLHADDVIFVGSPGVGVDHAADLGVDPSHVWATVASGDAIQGAVQPQSLLSKVFTGRPAKAWFGTSPTAPEFGANVFSSDPGSLLHPVDTHERYFDTGTRSLTNVVKIATGDGSEVS